MEKFDLISWSREEELSLCRHLQRAYDYDPPQMPNLEDMMYSLGHNEQEIKYKSQDLLRVMLSKAYPEKTGLAIDCIVHELLKQWN